MKTPLTYTLQQADELLARHPYYTLPAVIAIRQAQTSPAAARQIPDTLLRRTALSLHSHADMTRIFGQEFSIFDNFYPDEQRHTPGTMDTIDTFLSTFGQADPHETDALEKLIFSSTPDYGAVLAAEERGSLPTAEDINDPSLSAQDKLINSFIAANHTSAPAPVGKPVPAATFTPQTDKQTNPAPSPAPRAKRADSPQLTESLVKILIKNRNYSKAIEIISELHLNNPKKSAYFADQIRFLKKLIINDNKK